MDRRTTRLEKRKKVKFKIYLTSDKLRNWIRTVVPSSVASVIAYFLHKWFPTVTISWLHHLAAGWYFALNTAVLGAYYGAFRWLEGKYRWASAFLGALPVGYLPKPPKIAPTPAPQPVTSASAEIAEQTSVQASPETASSEANGPVVEATPSGDEESATLATS